MNILTKFYVSCVNYSVLQVIEKTPAHPRARVFREVETFHHCQGQPNIIELLDMFEDEKYFYLVFEKVRFGFCVLSLFLGAKNHHHKAIENFLSPKKSEKICSNF